MDSNVIKTNPKKTTLKMKSHLIFKKKQQSYLDYLKYLVLSQYKSVSSGKKMVRYNHVIQHVFSVRLFQTTKLQSPVVNPIKNTRVVCKSAM